MSLNAGRFSAKLLDPTLSARSLYGAELRYYRERAGLTLEELADRLHIEMSFLARIEQGERRLSDELARAVDDILGTGGFFARNLVVARSAPAPGRLTPLAEWEWLATAIREWDAALVPGLLQTDAYAEAVAKTYAALLADRPTRHRWDARLSRTPSCWTRAAPATPGCSARPRYAARSAVPPPWPGNSTTSPIWSAASASRCTSSR